MLDIQVKFVLPQVGYSNLRLILVMTGHILASSKSWYLQQSEKLFSSTLCHARCIRLLKQDCSVM